ncbi:MAG TPA: hypothetical protein VFW47_01290 [Phenylobacterium sp.]|nr:hypothetical protein [Phenylobacterium sp.]
MIAVFVAEIVGRPVIALNAEGVAEAEAVLAEPGVRIDLQQFLVDGQALWNGEDEIYVRTPHAAERALWEESFHKALAESGACYEDAVRETWICLLVAVSGPLVRR